MAVVWYHYRLYCAIGESSYSVYAHKSTCYDFIDEWRLAVDFRDWTMLISAIVIIMALSYFSLPTIGLVTC